MRHSLMDPAFPDIVGELARREAPHRRGPANDNLGDEGDNFAEIFLLEIMRREVEAHRAW